MDKELIPVSHMSGRELRLLLNKAIVGVERGTKPEQIIMHPQTWHDAIEHGLMVSREGGGWTLGGLWARHNASFPVDRIEVC